MRYPFAPYSCRGAPAGGGGASFPRFEPGSPVPDSARAYQCGPADFHLLVRIPRLACATERVRWFFRPLTSQLSFCVVCRLWQVPPCSRTYSPQGTDVRGK